MSRRSLDVSLNVTVLLGSINITEGGSTVGNESAVENILIMSESAEPPSGQIWDLGGGLIHNSTGVSDFTADSDPDFLAIANLLSNGLEEVIDAQTVLLPSGSRLGSGGSESYFLQRNPDLVGYEINFLRLNVTTLDLNYSNGVTDLFETYSWEIWGHPLFVFFVPPTDPDPTYLIDRDYTNVRVRLAAPVVPTLEWNGLNQSMVPIGANWSAAVSSLSNGEYSYRVWASNTTGSVFVTPTRHLSVGVGIWHLEHVGIGFLPSVAVNASGEPRLCYAGQGGLVYAERYPSGWRNRTIGSGGSGCSIALNSKGEAHISFVTSEAYIGYAVSNGTQWSTAIVSQGHYVRTSIAIDPITDEPMISYADPGVLGLELATFVGSQWTLQLVDPSFYGEATSLAVDSFGRPAIAYPDYTSETLRVAQWTGSRWSISTVDSSVTEASIRFDAGGIPHVAYASPAGLQLAIWNGTGWARERVDVGRYFGISLVFDALGQAHIGYSMGYGGDVREAVKDGAWKIQVITHRNGNSRAGLVTTPQGISFAGFELDIPNGDIVTASNFVDTLSPTTLAHLNGTTGSEGWYRSPVAVRLESADDWSGVASVEYRLDGGSWTAYVREFQVSSDGRHVLDYRAVDFAGNVEPAKSTLIDLDRSPPDVHISAPAGTVTTSDVTVRWQGADSTSGIGQYELSIDGGPKTPVGMERTANLTLADGSHTVQIRAIDMAGNSAVFETTFVVDTNPFSLAGPFHGLPTIVVILVPVIVAALALWFRRRRRLPPGSSSLEAPKT